MSGHEYPEGLAKWHFWITMVGMNLTFFPMHFSGLAGMPRRIADYPDAYAGRNLLSSMGAYISFAAALLFLYILRVTFKSTKPVEANHWGKVQRHWSGPCRHRLRTAPTRLHRRSGMCRS